MLPPRLHRAFAVQQHFRVPGFATLMQAILIYIGSFTWFAVLVTSNALMLARDGDLQHGRLLYGFLLGSNVLTFTVQTVDVLTYNQTLWHLVALNWTSQLGGIGLAAAALGRALTTPDTERVLLCVGLLYAQCLFTASQFAVTLSTLWRAVEAFVARPQQQRRLTSITAATAPPRAPRHSTAAV